MSGLAAGVAIGVAGDAGVRAVAKQTKMYVGMVLILIFAEVRTTTALSRTEVPLPLLLQAWPAAAHAATALAMLH